MDNNHTADIIALHQADCDMKKENLDEFIKGQRTIEQLVEQEAIIGRLFKAGMESILEKANNVIDDK